jgi:hypothetical protein
LLYAKFYRLSPDLYRKVTGKSTASFADCGGREEGYLQLAAGVV